MFKKGEFYHVYNRSINKERLFYNADNYQFFLKRYRNYLSNFVNTYAYCLIPNHFHFLIKPIDNSRKISEQFRRFFISYAQAINKQENRNGSLFQKKFRKKKIVSRPQLLWLVYYIHRNPVHHHIENSFANYRWSSYQALISNSATKLNRAELHNLFNSKKAFINFHNQNAKADFEKIEDVILE